MTVAWVTLGTAELRAAGDVRRAGDEVDGVRLGLAGDRQRRGLARLGDEVLETAGARSSRTSRPARTASA